MHAESKSAIHAAMAANGTIALLKGFGAAVTGSASMFSEAVHSLVDTGNQVLLLIGMRDSSRAADNRHHFGKNGAMFFWVLFVGVSIFGLGAIVSGLECWHKLAHPEPLDHSVYDLFGFLHPSLKGTASIPAWGLNLSILVGAMLAEGKSCLVALKAFSDESDGKGILRALRDAKDPTVPAVIIEDFAAVLGLGVAMACQILAYAYDEPLFDAAGCGIISLILCFASLFLIVECRSLQMNEAIEPGALQSVIDAIESRSNISRVSEIKTMHIGPTAVLVCLSVDFVDTMSAAGVEAAVGSLRDEIERILASHYGKNVEASVYINVESWRTFGEGFMPEPEGEEEDGGKEVEEEKSKAKESESGTKTA